MRAIFPETTGPRNRGTSMGFRRFGCRGLQAAQAEMAIAVLGYNLKTMIGRLGVQRMLAALA